MGWRVKFNHLGAVGRAMPRAIDNEVDEAADAMVLEFKSTLWVDTRLLRRVTTEKNVGPMHAEVQVGFYLEHGFYSGFQEFGTVKQPARPIVGPTAHRFEPQYAHEMAEAVREACEAQ